MVAPPSLAGAVNGTEAVVTETEAVPIVGAPGTLAVVTLFDAALWPPVPAPLMACTWNVYDVFADKPVTLIGDDALVPVMLPGFDVAMYPVIDALPVSVGAVKGTDAVNTDTLAVPIVGAPGLRGQMPCLAYDCAWSSVQIPLATVAVGAVGFLVTIPPGYCLMLIYILHKTFCKFSCFSRITHLYSCFRTNNTAQHCFAHIFTMLRH